MAAALSVTDRIDAAVDMDESRSGYDDVALEIDALLDRTADAQVLIKWWRKFRKATV